MRIIKANQDKYSISAIKKARIIMDQEKLK